MNPDRPNPSKDENPFGALGDILKKVASKGRLTKKGGGNRAKAAAVLREHFPLLAARTSVVSVKTGVVTLETDSAVQMQEIEAFHRQALIERLRAAGLQVAEVRARLRQ